MSDDRDPILSIRDLDTYYATSQVLFDVSVDVYENEIVGVFGRNGMGKTTLLRSIVNHHLVECEGSISCSGDDITKMATSDIVRDKRIAYIPEDRGIYGDLTVAENLKLVDERDITAGEFERRRDMVLEMFPILADLLDRKGGQLSGGEQQMLAITRGLITMPDIVLLDEPTEGLAPVIVDDLVEVLGDLVADDWTIVMVEQNITQALELIDRGFVMEKGRIVEQGDRSVLADPDLQDRYLTV